MHDYGENIFLSVVIPAYNEELRIGKSLTKIISYLNTQSYKSEIIVVDNGSSDRTAEKVKAFRSDFEALTLLSDGRIGGKGYAVKKGILHSRGEYVLFSDADLSTPIEEVEKLLRYIQDGYDVTIGSRGLKESEIERIKF